MTRWAPTKRTTRRTVVKQAKTDQIASYHDSHLSKAVIRTYMAWQEPPDVQYLGLAIQKGHFQNIEAACAQFLDWLGTSLCTIDALIDCSAAVTSA